MTKSAAHRAIAGGCNARVFSQTAPTNLKSLHHKPRAGAFGADLPVGIWHRRDKGSANLQDLM